MMFTGREYQTLVSGPLFPLLVPLLELPVSSSVVLIEEMEGLSFPLIDRESPICLLMEGGRPAPRIVHSRMVRPKMRNMR